MPIYPFTCGFDSNLKSIAETIWYLIIKNVVEGQELAKLLLYINNNKLNIWLRLQPGPDIFSTIYIGRSNCLIDTKINTWVWLAADNFIYFNGAIIDLGQNMFDICLIHGDNIIFGTGSAVGYKFVGDGQIVTINKVRKLNGFGHIFEEGTAAVGQFVFWEL